MAAEAKVKVRLDGVNEVQTAIEKLRTKVEDTKKAINNSEMGRSWKAFGDVVKELSGSTLGGLVASADRASRSLLGITDIDVTGAKRRYREIEDSVTKLALRSGQTIAEMKQHIRDLANTRHIAEKEVVASINRTLPTTGSPEQSLDIAEFAARERQRSGNPEAAERFGVQAMNNMGVKSGAELRRTADVVGLLAERFGIRGGRGGFMQLLGQMDFSRSFFRDEESRNRNLGLIAAMAGNLPPEQALRRAQTAIDTATNTDDLKVTRTLKTKGYIDAATGRRDPYEVLAALKGEYGTKMPRQYQRLAAMINELGGGAYGAGYTLESTDVGGAGTAGQNAAARILERQRAALVARIYAADRAARGVDAGATVDLLANKDAAPLRAIRERVARMSAADVQRHFEAVTEADLTNERTAYERTAAGQRAKRETDLENSDTRVIGGGGQRMEDQFNEAFDGHPTARRIVGQAIQYIPGASTVAAGVAGAAAAIKVDLTDESAAKVGRAAAAAGREGSTGRAVDRMQQSAERN